MAVHDDNSFCFSARVVEEILKDGTRILKVLCRPGTFILNIPDSSSLGLGDHVCISGSFHIEGLEKMPEQREE